MDGDKEVSVEVEYTEKGQGSYNLTVKDATGTVTEYKGVRVLEVGADGDVTADVGDRRVKGRAVREGEKLHVFFEVG
jgi:PKD repeat protein